MWYSSVTVQIIAGIVMLALSLLCWAGQAIVLFAPATGVRLGLCEAEEAVEPTFWADVRGEALWDFATLWTMVVAAVLLILDRDSWAYFGLVGGGMYAYFAGRGISTRVAMRRRGIRIGSEAAVKAAFVLLTVWAVMGVATIIAAATVLSTT
jgi:hypothetical protein